MTGLAPTFLRENILLEIKKLESFDALNFFPKNNLHNFLESYITATQFYERFQKST